MAKQCRGDKLTGRLFGLFELLRGYSYMTSAFRVGGGRVREKIGRLRIGGEGRLAVFPGFLNIGECGNPRGNGEKGVFKNENFSMKYQ